MGGGAGIVAVLEDVAGPVDPRTLAVPHGEDAVVACAGEQPGLLGAPDRGRREILVQPGFEDDVVFVQMGARAPELEVERP